MSEKLYNKIGGENGMTLEVQDFYNVEFLIVDERRDYVAGRYRGFEKTKHELEVMVYRMKEQFEPYKMTAYQSIDHPTEIVIKASV